MSTRQIILGPEFDAFVDDTEETLVGGYEHESPEDSTWGRSLEDLFRAGLNAGTAIGMAKGWALAMEAARERWAYWRANDASEGERRDMLFTFQRSEPVHGWPDDSK